MGTQQAQVESWWQADQRQHMKAHLLQMQGRPPCEQCGKFRCQHIVVQTGSGAVRRQPVAVQKFRHFRTCQENRFKETKEFKTAAEKATAEKVTLSRASKFDPKVNFCKVKVKQPLKYKGPPAKPKAPKAWQSPFIALKTTVHKPHSKLLSNLQLKTTPVSTEA